MRSDRASLYLGEVMGQPVSNPFLWVLHGSISIVLVDKSPILDVLANAVKMI